jgi:hypothetical protein
MTPKDYVQIAKESRRAQLMANPKYAPYQEPVDIDNQQELDARVELLIQVLTLLEEKVEEADERGKTANALAALYWNSTRLEWQSGWDDASFELLAELERKPKLLSTIRWDVKILFRMQWKILTLLGQLFDKGLPAEIEAILSVIHDRHATEGIRVWTRWGISESEKSTEFWKSTYDHKPVTGTGVTPRIPSKGKQTKIGTEKVQPKQEKQTFTGEHGTSDEVDLKGQSQPSAMKETTSSGGDDARIATQSMDMSAERLERAARLHVEGETPQERGRRLTAQISSTEWARIYEEANIPMPFGPSSKATYNVPQVEEEIDLTEE